MDGLFSPAFESDVRCDDPFPGAKRGGRFCNSVGAFGSLVRVPTKAKLDAGSDMREFSRLVIAATTLMAPVIAEAQQQDDLFEPAIHIVRPDGEIERLLQKEIEELEPEPQTSLFEDAKAGGERSTRERGERPRGGRSDAHGGGRSPAVVSRPDPGSGRSPAVVSRPDPGGGRSPAVTGKPGPNIPGAGTSAGSQSGRPDRGGKNTAGPSSGASAEAIRPKPETVSVIRANKEAMTRSQISVRDQAIRRALDVVARQRDIQKHQMVGVVSGYFRLNSAPPRHDRTQPRTSKAHYRGAFDVSVRTSKNPAQEAAEISKELGRGFLVIHEKPSADRKTQTNTTYRPDGTVGVKTGVWGTQGFQADGEHIHVQPQPGAFGPEPP